MGFDISATEFQWRAGQYISIVLPEHEDGEVKDSFHEFSIASAPGASTMTVAFRLSNSVFKQTLLSKKPGDAVTFEGPFGVFYPPDSAKGVIYIAGGIGITAFLGALEQKANYPVHLYTFNHSEASEPYKDLLASLAREKGFVLHQHYGRITEEALDFIPGLQTYVLIAGPNEFVKTARQLALNMGIMEQKIQTEEFTGYA